LKYNVLSCSSGARRAKTRGTPKNEGESAEVCENKGQEKIPQGRLEMLLKTKCLSVSSGKVDEKKGT
jgi:hypothetical protein